MHAFCLIVNPEKNWGKLKEQIGTDYCGPAELTDRVFKDATKSKGKVVFKKDELIFLKNNDGTSNLCVGVYIDDDNCLNNLYCDDKDEFAKTVGKLYDSQPDDVEVQILDIHY